VAAGRQRQQSDHQADHQPGQAFPPPSAQKPGGAARGDPERDGGEQGTVLGLGVFQLIELHRPLGRAEPAVEHFAGHLVGAGQLAKV
jgi:hypothetical protein